MLERLAIVDYPAHPGKPNDETRWVKWFHHLLRMPNKKQYEWGYVHCRDTVAIVAVDQSNNIALVSQYRYAYGRSLTEIPKGFVENGETYLSAAQRELREETKHVGSEWRSLEEIVAAPGIGRIADHVFLAQELLPCENTEAPPSPDEQDEELKVEWVTLDEFFNRVARGSVIDAVTIAAVTKARLLIGG